MNPYKSAMHRFAQSSWMRWLLSRLLTPLDTLFKGSRFTPSTLGLDTPLCYLTTIGRKSGNQRTVPLFYVEASEESLAVVASNFGRTAHPAWSYNLDADPHATLEIAGTTSDVIGRLATDHESGLIWPKFQDVWPGYDEYRRIAPRNIKMYILDRVAAGN